MLQLEQLRKLEALTVGDAIFVDALSHTLTLFERHIVWQPIEKAPRNRDILLNGGYVHRVYGWLWGQCRWYDDVKHPQGGYFICTNGGTPTHYLLVPDAPVPIPDLEVI